jgi:signal transduction histidine kinase
MTPPPFALLMRSHWVRHGLLVLLFNTVMSALMALQSGQRWVLVWVYAQCIGLSIWLIVEPLSLWLDRRGTLGRPRWLAVVALGIMLGYLLGKTLGDALLGWSSWYEGEQAWLQWSKEASLTVTAGVVATGYFLFRERLAQTRAEAEAARRLATESQLRLLQAQLEPHMLFNTLANLRVLITLDPPQAQAMLDRLIAFLRATLTASRQDAHPLSDEFERLADYLALMQVRMGPRLQTTLNLPEALRDWPVPPLLLQPLVENAIQHGLEPKRGGGELRVTASAPEGLLRIEVHDTGLGLAEAGAQPEGKRQGTGFGLTQVRERLAATWGTAASLHLQPAPGGGTLVTLILPKLAPHP